ncbi:hypothetical protein RRG08_000174 [Elysia crispata]|uniref:Uncharacterized protein n=1 Tax=Elysia crispata TaxID=231223 RepID=A0AAE1D5X8_9GAST|nr:hypothetical protein RRG08_000174 [Elysia crispata]
MVMADVPGDNDDQKANSAVELVPKVFNWRHVWYEGISYESQFLRAGEAFRPAVWRGLCFALSPDFRPSSLFRRPQTLPTFCFPPLEEFHFCQLSSKVGKGAVQILFCAHLKNGSKSTSTPTSHPERGLELTTTKLTRRYLLTDSQKLFRNSTQKRSFWYRFRHLSSSSSQFISCTRLAVSPVRRACSGRAGVSCGLVTLWGSRNQDLDHSRSKLVLLTFAVVKMVKVRCACSPDLENR